MEALTKLALAAVDLAEAELQSLQRGTMRLVIAICFAIGGVVLALMGVGMLLWAGYWGLAHLVGPVAGLAISGIVFAAVGGGLMLYAWKKVTSARTTTAAGPRQPSGVTAEKRAEEAAALKREAEKAFKEGRQATSAEGQTNDPSSLRIAS